MMEKHLHSEAGDEVIAELMNALEDGSISLFSQAHTELAKAVDIYLLERGYESNQLSDIWSGEIQLTSS